MELKYIVYITVNLCNGKIYVGVHKTNPDVFDGYIGGGINRKGDCTKNTPFHKAVRKYGYENFKRTTISVFPDSEEGRKAAFKLESDIVTEHFIKSKTTYNLALGGSGSPIEQEYKKVYMFGINGNYLRSFKSVRKAAEFLNTTDVYITMKSIRNCCLGTTSSSHGYVWSYNKKFIYNSLVKRKVAQYTVSGKFLKYFNSIAEAEEALSCNCIHQALSKNRLAGGYQWKYYDGCSDNISPLLNFNTKKQLFPIIMYKKDGSETHEYNNVNECVKQNPSLKSSQISRVLKNIIRTHKGWCFKYKDEDIV